MIKFHEDYAEGWWQSWASKRGVRHEYARLRSLGWKACDAWRTAKIRERFAKLEAEGRVQLLCEPDWEPYDHGDCGDEEATNARIDSEGVWVLGALAVVGAIVDAVDSCGNFIGEDWKDSFYDDDIMLAACELAELRGCEPSGPVCEGRAA